MLGVVSLCVQEPDAGALDDPSDPEFKATKEDLQVSIG